MKSVNNNSVKWLKKFSRKKIIDNKNIVELLKYDQYSLWWFLEWLMEFGTFHFLDINSILHNPSQPTRYNKTASIFKFLRIFIRKIIWSWFRMFGTDEKRHYKKLVVFISDLHQLVYDTNKKKFVMDERFLPVINSIKNMDVAVLNLPYKKEAGFGAYDKGLSKNTLFFPIEHFMGISEFFKALKIFKIYKNTWKQIKASKSLDFMDLNIKKHIVNNFDYFFSGYLFLTLWEIEGYKSFTQEFKPDLICTYDPFNPYGFKPRLAFKGKMLAIQYGFWGTPESEYLHSKHDMHTYPLVDYASVFDSKIKNNLVNISNFPRNKIFITNNPKAEDLSMKIKIFGLNIEENTILFLSQPFNDQKEFYFFLKEVFQFFKQIPYEKKVIRPHPSETNIKIYKLLIKKYRIQNVYISNPIDEDIIFPLSKSKLVISCNSTAIIEARLLGKPVILVDVWKKGYADFFQRIPSVQNSEGLMDFFHKFKKKSYNPNLNPSAYLNTARLIKKLTDEKYGIKTTAGN
mgnify:FL=1